MPDIPSSGKWFTYKLPYVVTDAEGNETTEKHRIRLPKFGQLPFGLIRKFRKESAGEQFFSLLESLLTDADFEKVDLSPQDEMNKMIEAWQKDSNITAGES
ncbi:MAG: hypothetical protein LC723_13645 [Actinobacteria bacterium]|nr:hypothetical protein [Actinomycetota bacterium]